MLSYIVDVALHTTLVNTNPCFDLWHFQLGHLFYYVVNSVSKRPQLVGCLVDTIAKSGVEWEQRDIPD